MNPNLLFTISQMNLSRPDSIEADNDEADERKDERGVHRRQEADRTLVDDPSLERRKHRAAQDCHNKTGGTELGIVP